MSQRDIQTGFGGPEQERRRTPEEIEADISQTRSAISEDIRELGEKLSPEHLKESAKGAVRDAAQGARDMARDVKDSAVGYAQQVGTRAREAGGATARFTSDNAAPLALIGLGVGWLAWSLRSKRMGGESDITLRGSSYRLGEYGEGARRGWYETGRELEPGYQGYGASAGQGTLDYYGGEPRTGETAFTEESYGAGATAPYAGGASMGGESVGGESVGEKARGAYERGKERAEDLVQRGKERVREWSAGGEERGWEGRPGYSEGVPLSQRLRGSTQRFGQRAGELGRNARDRLREVPGRTRDMASENPLAFGALALFTGIGIGMLLPSSRSERRLLGPTSQRWVGEAREAAERVGRVAKESAEDVRGRFESGVSH